MHKKELTDIEKRDISLRLVSGAVQRAQSLCLVYMAVFGAYAFTSYSFIHEFDKNVTWFGNTWPRLVFNVLPLFLMHLFFKHSKKGPRVKAWVWAVALPLVFLAACLVNVWGIMARGMGDIYLYVHSANTFILVTAIMVAAPPLEIIIAQTVSFTLFVILPITFLFVDTKNYKLLQFSLGDYLIAIPVVIIMGNMIHKLRYQIACLDLRTKKQASSFLGSHIAKAIYDNDAELLKTRRVNAVVVQMDIRSYTEFYGSNDVELVRAFMKEYHGLVSREVGSFGGYWHKSAGDAHLMTFGAMDPVPSDLSDIPNLDADLTQAEETRKAYYFKKAHAAVQQVVEKFEELKVQHGITNEIRLGIGMTYGDLEVRVQGDAAHKRELDIDGVAIILCARLEEYTKYIRTLVAPKSSLLVVAPELALPAEAAGFLTWQIEADNSRVRNFPAIKRLHYRIFAPPVASNVRRLPRAS
jgi:class 3 adenylate cyclase